jgi:hypothetical protein
MVSVKLHEILPGDEVTLRCKECGSFLGHYAIISSNTTTGEVYLALPRKERPPRFRKKRPDGRFVGLVTQPKSFRYQPNHRLSWRCPEGHPRIRRIDRLAWVDGIRRLPYPEFYL